MSDAQELEEELRNGSEEKLPEEPSANDGTGDDSALSDDFENLAIEIGKLKDTLARSQADYKNLVARTERERLEMADFVTEKLVSRLLPSVDNLERLLSGTSESERSGALYEGVKSTFSGIVRTLESLGVSTFDSVGETLDPAFHEAVAQVPGEAGKIANEFEKGYKLQGKVIRHAKVTVGNGEEA
ncbi:MAG: molecular chaperone GrpE [Patescibacteria group bacterium]|nr:molecular chaperone GrpE [Patescibacteria group bacterium]